MAKFIGSHVSMSSPDYYLGSIKETLDNLATTLMLYTGAPQNNIRTPIENLKIKEALALVEENDLDISKFVVHAPYIINLANPIDSTKVDFSKKVLLNELERTTKMGINVIVLHPGSFVSGTRKEGLNTLISSLNDVLNTTTTTVKIALETMAGKGSEVGISFNEIKYIIDSIDRKDLIGVCLDTCHLNDSGIDVSNPDDVLAMFDNIIGLNYLLCVHLNDSKNELGSHKDRHENIGYGTLGFDVLKRWFDHPLLKEVPLILETPYINKKSPYKKEIEMLRNGEFDINFKELI